MKRKQPVSVSDLTKSDVMLIIDYILYSTLDIKDIVKEKFGFTPDCSIIDRLSELNISRCIFCGAWVKKTELTSEFANFIRTNKENNICKWCAGFD